MSNKKLILCCVVGIIGGFAAPYLFGANKNTALTIGLAAGLFVGFIWEWIDMRRRGIKGNPFSVIVNKADKPDPGEEQKTEDRDK